MGQRGVVTAPYAVGDSPLYVHARYTRDEILAAIGVGMSKLRPPAWQTGVWSDSASRADLLAFTIDKTAGSFSPTTRYRDYAISERLVHWESQSVAHAASPAGRRYIDHESEGWSMLLFARPTTNDRSLWFLGPATYVSHEGERPMAITWRLAVPLPEPIHGAMAAAVA